DFPDFHTVFQQRQRVDGPYILATDIRHNGVTVRVYHVPSGKDVWKKECATGSLLAQCEDDHLGAVVETDGSLTVVDLRSGREILKTRVDPRDIEKAQSITLLEDRTQFYLAINGPRDVQQNPWGGPVSNFQPSSGYRCVPVNGRLYAFDRQSGKVNWAS